MPHLYIVSIIPELLLTIASMVILMVGVYGKKNHTLFLNKVAIGALLLAGFKLIQLNDLRYITTFNELASLDSFAIFLKVLITIASIFTLILSVERMKEEKLSYEFISLLLLAVVGMMVMVSANDLMSLYMGLELQSLSLYVLASISRRSVRSSEAGLKYFMLGALSSGILLYGASLIYGFTGTTNFSTLVTLYSDTQNTLPVGVLLGVIFVLIGLSFKVSAVPFHMWTPDVYEGAPKIVTAFFASAPKVAAMGLLMRFLFQPFQNFADEWQQIIIVVSMASMILAALAALRQNNIKRLMAYSSIGHVGYMLMGVASGTLAGAHGTLIYLAVYISMSLGVFACIIAMERHNESMEKISDLAGLAKKRPLFAASLAVLMFSMAGVPPMAGFFGKFFVFQAALKAELYTLAIIGVLTSVIAAFYYLRIVKVMYFDSSKEILDGEITPNLQFTLLCTAVFNLMFFLLPTPLLNAAKDAAKALFM